MKILFSALLSLLPSLLCSADRPNILFAFADDWGRYASVYQEALGEGTVNDILATPAFDRIAKEGVLFKNAHVNAPSCTPCRSALLSGQYFFRTGRAAILQGAVWDEAIPSFPLLLRDSGYHIGKIYKVWSPGDPRDAPIGEQAYGWENKAGANGTNMNAFSQVATKLVADGASVEEAKAKILSKPRAEFAAFLDDKADDEPFFFWFGPTNTHRVWTRGSGKALWGLDPDELEGKMPSFLPDVPIVREDFADYLGEAMAFDAGLGELVAELEERGMLENTLIVVSGDHGAPGFPRGKCNLYDFGTNVALAARWGNGKIPGGRVVEDFVNLMDLAPTFLEAGAAEVPEEMTGRSLLPVVESDRDGLVDKTRTWVVTGRERHVGDAREGNKPYPQRAIRTREHLYIVNFEPDRWPMGSPGPVDGGNLPDFDTLAETTFVCYSDLDASPTKAWMIENREHTDFAHQFELGFGKRPGVELYVVAEDPDQVHNRAGEPELADVEKELRERLFAELKAAQDPRLTEDPIPFENSPYTDAVERRSKKGSGAKTGKAGKGQKAKAKE